MLRYLAILLLSSLSAYAQPASSYSVSMERMRVDFSIDDAGVPRYAVYFNEQEVIRPSALGFSLDADSSFYHSFSVWDKQQRSVNENWSPVWGEVNSISNRFNELKVQLLHKNGRLLNIVFRVFADGIGFRYEFPQQTRLDYFVVRDERTEFNLAGDHKTFWIPGDYDTNEYPYSTTKISEIDNREMVAKSTEITARMAPDRYAVQTPLMMKTAGGIYINIHEAALVGYPAMQLHVNRQALSLTSSLVPDPVGNKAYLRAPFATPWRTIIVSDKAADILASKIILNLNEPSQISNTSWIKPMKFVGVWWELQTNKSSWSYADRSDTLTAAGALIPHGHHGANTANVKRYIDFAANNNIGGVLVEGWNLGWEDWFGKWKENVFDFTTPYPDFNLNELTAYAASKGVSIIMHNETSGSATDYERQMDTAFRFMNKFGYTSVKTGYVGRIIPRGEFHDGQWMIEHYQRSIQKAANHHVMIDIHEAVRPTGLHRAWPNFIASEAARGNEFNAFSDGNPPEHETILPFTRMVGGPMDYTPGIFKLKGYAGPGRQVHTTIAKQLALYVTLYSPLQMAADLPENYEAKPDAFEFIRDVPVDWDDTRILEAEPGDYISIARKGKGTANWYVGCITDENSRTAMIPLGFLDANRKYLVTIYKDGTGADWKTNPESYTIEKYWADNGGTLKIQLANGGGAAVSIKPLTGNVVPEGLKKQK